MPYYLYLLKELTRLLIRWKNDLLMTNSYLKCNAELARPGISSTGSTDSIHTSFLFPSSAFISLHENAPAPAKFCKKGRSQGDAGWDWSNLRRNLAIFDQNLAVFGASGGRSSLNDHVPRAENETGVTSEVRSAPNKSTGYKFHFLVNVSECLILSHYYAPDRSFFQKTKPRNLGLRRKFDGVSFLVAPKLSTSQTPVQT
jgi:hypothetical protein